MASNPFSDLRLTYIGGPTALIEVGGLRMLTDPTFDPAGAEIRAGTYALTKTEGPAIGAGSIGHLDAVLLSHDHHFDNLDLAGRLILEGADRVLTTEARAERLGGRAMGLPNWQAVEIPAAGERTLLVTGTPARHGPAHMDRGPVTGFALALPMSPGAPSTSRETRFGTRGSLKWAGGSRWRSQCSSWARRASMPWDRGISPSPPRRE